MISHLRSVALLLAVALATVAPAFGQTAYFSVEGDFATGAELHDFFLIFRGA